MLSMFGRIYFLDIDTVNSYHWKRCWVLVGKEQCKLCNKSGPFPTWKSKDFCMKLLNAWSAVVHV